MLFEKRVPIRAFTKKIFHQIPACLSAAHCRSELSAAQSELRGLFRRADVLSDFVGDPAVSFPGPQRRHAVHAVLRSSKEINGDIELIWRKSCGFRRTDGK
jgi:hypothetical protein